jgi:hypothetical protein
MFFLSQNQRYLVNGPKNWISAKFKIKIIFEPFLFLMCFQKMTNYKIRNFFQGGSAVNFQVSLS